MSKWTKEKIQALSFSEEQFDFVDKLADAYLLNLKKFIASKTLIDQVKGGLQNIECICPTPRERWPNITCNRCEAIAAIEAFEGAKN